MHLFISLILMIAIFLNVEAVYVPRDFAAYLGDNSSITAPNNLTSSDRASWNTTESNGSYWLEQITHQSGAAFNKDLSYKTFRNVKDFGAKGDGVSDDTAALNLAISGGNRCRSGDCNNLTTTPALVYIPAGTYMVSAPIIDYYLTQIIGNPNDLPILKATKAFAGFSLIDGDPYQAGSAAHHSGSTSDDATNGFFRQIRNLVVDTTDVPVSVSIKAINWSSGRATSLGNLIIRMSDQAGTQHQGLIIESGSGGFMSDMIFYGGRTGALISNRQATSRNLRFFNAIEAIEHNYNWGWTYKSIYIKNCSVGLNMTNVDSATQNVGSMTIMDSIFTNTLIGIATSHDSSHWSVSNGSLILENIDFRNVRLAVIGTKNQTALSTNSGDLHVEAWGIGHKYTPSGPQDFLGTLPAVNRSSSLTQGTKNGRYFERSKPQYNDVPATGFVSVQSQAAIGDGITDDTDALQSLLDEAGASNDHIIVYFDAGTYRITRTLHFPKMCKIVGESYATIMSSGPFFADINNPQPVIQVGNPGDIGSVEWSDMIVSTQGAQAGAILIQWNVATLGQPSGMWDVHTRIGGFTGSNLGHAECPASSGGSLPSKASAGINHTPISVTNFQTTSSVLSQASPSISSAPIQTSPLALKSSFMNTTANDSSLVNIACIGAFMSMHITKSASGLYMENVCLWTADHDLDTSLEPITVYTGRGLLVDSVKGVIWMVGTSSEHHSLYQYQLARTQNIFLGQMETETAYYQPHPRAGTPFPPVEGFNDPHISELCKNGNGPCDGYGLRILDSRQVAVYGANLYSFYKNYDDSCSLPSKQDCQSSIFSIEGNSSTDITIYNLNTVGATSMVDRDGMSLANYSDNVDVSPDAIALFRIG